MTDAELTLNPTVPVNEHDRLEPDTLQKYLQPVLGLTGSRFQVRRFPAGFSNLTYLITTEEKKFVLRRPPFGVKARSAHDMGREYKVLSSLKPLFPLCPTPLHYCEDESIIGSPFFVMEHLDGLILRQDASSTDPDMFRVQATEMMRVLATLHRLDPNHPEISIRGTPDGSVDRQIRGWSERFRASRTEDVPDFETVMAWISDHRPPATATLPAVIHNDYKPDNIVFDPRDPGRIIGVLDWEMATLGDACMDLGNSLAYWVEKSDPPDKQIFRTMPTDLPGAPTRREMLAIWEENTGHKIDNFSWYYLFGVFRLAVISQQIYFRFSKGQANDPRFSMMSHAVKAMERVCRNIMETGDY